MDRRRLLLVAIVTSALASLVIVWQSADSGASVGALDTISTSSSSSSMPSTSSPVSTTTSPTTSTSLGVIADVTSTTTEASPTSSSATTTTAPQPSPSSTNTPTTTTGPPAPAFQYSIGTVTANDLYASWRPGCPLGVEQLRAVDVSFWGYNGAVRTGRLIVAASLVQDVAEIMRDLYETRFPVERMDPVDAYDGDDNRSMAANNTSAFNCRAVSGGSSWSEHSYGRAIDINPLVNPYVKGSTVLPSGGAPFVNRNQDTPGMIHADDEVVQAFAARGWIWGGTWGSLKDYQHFSTTGP